MIGTKQYVVPCGKCADCRKKKQAEFAALSLHQGLHSGSLYFFTLTYRNETTPIALHDYDLDGPRLIGFERGCVDWLDSQGRFMNGFKGDRACSLCREDVKLVLKHFRSLCKEKDSNFSERFKYVFFGEYGESHGRPHYHGLVFGLTPEESLLFRQMWTERFGFVYCAPEPGAKLVSLDDIQAMSLYISKYISKGVSSRWSYLMPYVEKSRRQSSLNFGDFSKEELHQLANFMMGATLWTESECRNLLSWTLFRLDANLCQLLVNHSPFLNV